MGLTSSVALSLDTKARPACLWEGDSSIPTVSNTTSQKQSFYKQETLSRRRQRSERRGSLTISRHRSPRRFRDPPLFDALGAAMVVCAHSIGPFTPQGQANKLDL